MRMKLTRIACIGGLFAVLLTPPGMNAQTTHQAVAGDTTCFTLIAIDSHGNPLTDWDQTGSTCNIMLRNSTANTDTSYRAWSANRLGYSFSTVMHEGVPLTWFPPNTWTLSQTVFVNGRADICWVHTKAEDGVYLEFRSSTPGIHAMTPAYNVQAGAPQHFLLDMTSADPYSGKVYRSRTFEVLVTIRDAYLNPLPGEYEAAFTAAYPDEFDADSIHTGIAGMPVIIDGETPFLFSANTERAFPEMQRIGIRLRDDTAVTGQTEPFEVLRHGPARFHLTSPEDEKILRIVGYSTPVEFTWEASSDPYRDILTSEKHHTTASDTLRYTVYFTEPYSFIREVALDRYDDETQPRCLTTHGMIRGAAESVLLGNPDGKHVVWFVEATDGIYASRNFPERGRPGRLLQINGPLPGVEPLPHAPAGTTLSQNYPNPVPSGSVTNIRFETAAYGPVTLKVFDMLGCEAATIADEVLAPGVYNADFTVRGLSPGVYHYTLTAGGRSFTKSMIITR